MTDDHGRSGARPRSRYAARKRALDVLYEADLLTRDLAEVLVRRTSEDDTLPDYAVDLVRAVHRKRPEIDEIIRTSAEGWHLERMAVIDRNLLRIGIAELLFVDDVPPAVAIDQAVELAKELSTDDSGRFVNGILARVARDHDLFGDPATE